MYSALVSITRTPQAWWPGSPSPSAVSVSLLHVTRTKL
jgi:hypothetical protein